MTAFIEQVPLSAILLREYAQIRRLMGPSTCFSARLTGYSRLIKRANSEQPCRRVVNRHNQPDVCKADGTLYIAANDVQSFLEITSKVLLIDLNMTSMESCYSGIRPLGSQGAENETDF